MTKTNISLNALKNPKPVDLKEEPRTNFHNTFKLAPSSEFNSALKYFKNGEFSKVITHTKKILLKHPNDFSLWNLLGVSLIQKGEIESAIAAFEKVININPGFPDAYNNLGIIHHELGYFEKAIKNYNQAIKIKPEYVDAYNNKGITLKSLGYTSESLSSFNKALKINPYFVKSLCNKADLLKQTGDFDQATKFYQKAIKINPHNGEAHRQLSILDENSDKQAHKKVVEKLLNEGRINASNKCQLHYAYAYMQEVGGDYSIAYTHFVEGGALRKKLLKYNPVIDQVLFTKIHASASRVRSERLVGPVEALNPCPIFVLGMPRSGTTLTEQILSSHPSISGAGELEFVSRFGRKLASGEAPLNKRTLRNFRNLYISGLKDYANGKAFVVDKMPHNFRYVGLICAAFPEAKIIHVKRNAAATCWSNFRHYFSSNGLGYSYTVQDTVAYYKLYQELMQLWSALYSDRIYNLDYDMLTKHQHQETRFLIEHLELRWHDDCLEPEKNMRLVRTASTHQVRKAVYKGSSENWRKYQNFLPSSFSELHNISTS